MGIHKHQQRLFATADGRRVRFCRSIRRRTVVSGAERGTGRCEQSDEALLRAFEACQRKMDAFSNQALIDSQGQSVWAEALLTAPDGRYLAPPQRGLLTFSQAPVLEKPMQPLPWAQQIGLTVFYLSGALPLFLLGIPGLLPYWIVRRRGWAFSFLRLPTPA